MTDSLYFPEIARIYAMKGAEIIFWPTITQTKDGQVWLQGLVGCLIRVDGLEKIRRLPEQSLQVSSEQLVAAQTWFVQAEAERQQTNVLAPHFEDVVHGERTKLRGD